MTPSVPWVRETGWTDPIYIELEGGEQMQKISLSLISLLFCVPLFHDLTTKDLQMAWLFFFPLFDLVPLFFWTRIFSSLAWSVLCLLFPPTVSPNTFPYVCLCGCRRVCVYTWRPHLAGPLTRALWHLVLGWWQCCWAQRRQSRGGLSLVILASVLFWFNSSTSSPVHLYFPCIWGSYLIGTAWTSTVVLRTASLGAGSPTDSF